MTTSLNDLRRRTSEHSTQGRFIRAGRSEALVGALVACIGVFMLVETVRMDVTSAVNYLGPRFFPAMLGSLLSLLGMTLAVRVYLKTRPTRDVVTSQDSTAEYAAGTDTDSAAPGSDWKPLGLTLASLAVHVLLLHTAGWIIAGALLFWGVSYALGSRKLLRDLGISFIVSCAVQIAFSIGLGLTLPPGILIGVL